MRRRDARRRREIGLAYLLLAPTLLLIGAVLAYPLAWVAYTFARGAVVDWYPYPFLDVTQVGYPRALVSTAVVAVVFLGLAWVVRLVDVRSRPAP